MKNVYNNFIERIANIRELGNIYDQNITQYPLLTEILSDILRFQLVYVVSAFDRFMHDITRVNFIQSIQNKEVLTKKAENFNVPLSVILEIYQKTQFPLSFENNMVLYLNNEIYKQHSFLVFQHPDKIKEALSLIWEENYKWQKIAENMTITLSGNTNNDKEKYLKQKVTLIVERRNQIVHEADIDLVTNQKRHIDKRDITDYILTIEDLGNSIYKCLNNKCNKPA